MNFKRIFSFVLVLTILFGCIPYAFAANHPFTDVPSGCWYEEAVVYMYKNGYMSGISNTKFGPNNNMSRAMLVTVLHRLSGDPAPSTAAPFKDVSSSQYYAKAVAWAHKNNIVSGTSANYFSPNASISREQLVAILYRYANYKKLDTTARANLTKFSDYRKISSYALEPFQWAYSVGLISGVTSTSLSPSGLATRAQCAAILYRFTLWTKGQSSTPENGPTTPSTPQNNGNKITLQTPTLNIADYLQYPQKKDFGKYYNQALALYNAIVSHDEEITLHFPVTWNKLLSYEERMEQIPEILQSFRDSFTKVLNHMYFFEFDSYSVDNNGILAVTHPNLWVGYIASKMGMEDPSIYYRASNSASLYNGMYEREAVTKISEWICKKLQYEVQPDPVVALETGKGSCAAYSKLFLAMCQSAGIECKYQTGCVKLNDTNHSCANSQGCHAWNKVLIGSTWYYIDVMWMDSDTSDATSKHFLTDKLLYDQEIRYSFG